MLWVTRVVRSGGTGVELGLAELVATVRAELAAAATAGAGEPVRFPVNGVQLQVHVAVRKEGKTDAKVKVWVVEAGASGSLSREEIHTVTVELGAPVGPDGQPVKVTQGFTDKPV